MTNISLKATLGTILSLCALSLFVGLKAQGQTPTPSPSPQAGPAPTQVADPAAKDFEEKFNYLRQLSDEANKLIGSKDSASREAGRVKLEEAIELSQRLYQKLNDDDGLAKRVGPTIENAKGEFQFLFKYVEINSYSDLGSYYDSVNSWEKSIEYRKTALKLIREAFSDAEFKSSRAFSKSSKFLRVGEMTALGNIASTLLYNLDRPQEARGFAEQAAQIARQQQAEIKDDERLAAFVKHNEASYLGTVARSYRQTNELRKSIEYRKQALQIYRSLPGQKDQVITNLYTIGNSYWEIFDYESALKYLKEALQSSVDGDDKLNQSITLGSLGNLYTSLGDDKQSHDMFARRLEVLMSPGYVESLRNRKISIPVPSETISKEARTLPRFDDETLEFFRLSDIATTYMGLKEYDKSVEYGRKLLKGAPFGNPLEWRRVSLALIGRAYREEKDWPSALTYYQQATGISRTLSDKSQFGFDSANLGFVYLKSGKFRDALWNATQALLVFQSLGADKDNVSAGYSYALDVLSQAQNELGNRRLAIFYGKQAINAIQRERQQLQTLDQESQHSYLKKNEKPYRRLAAWLIAEGRIAEAEQVLSMLKEDELLDYLRRDDKVAQELRETLKLRPAEEEAFRRYEQLADQITRIGKEFGEIDAKRLTRGDNFSEKEKARWNELNERLADASGVFSRFLKDLEARFNVKATNDRRVVELSSTAALLKEIKEPRTVIISTIVGEDRLSLVVTTAEANRAHTVNVKATELNQLVADFRSAVTNPRTDPRPAGKQLYDKLFPPSMLKDLAGVDADTIVWSLDGTLRYVPIAALWDGKEYLAQKYANVVITLASRTRIKDAPTDRKSWTALGVGVSKPFGSFPALPAVPQELCSVVRDPRKASLCAQLLEGRGGILGGVDLADEEFTLQAFKFNLGRYPVVHIASHFSLNTGNETNSYLLLGGGEGEERKLTLAAVRDELRTQFSGVELLTLSACNTAMNAGEKSNGAEVESFGALAQEQGAKAVMATLWSVADKSTQLLMSAFYRLLEENPQMTKAAALRAAQQEMLAGRPVPAQSKGVRRDTGEADEEPSPDYSHPYYWSPFVLIGNWR
jgi:CHAT domain-containing protein